MSGTVFGGPARTAHGDHACPCGTGRTLANCCGPLLDGTRQATTAEELMRSRYTAYAVGDLHHLTRTWHPAGRPADLVPDPDLTWVRLQIVGTSAGGPGDRTGTVHFRAHFTGPDGPGVLEEVSLFGRRGRADRWVYDHAL